MPNVFLITTVLAGIVAIFLAIALTMNTVKSKKLQKLLNIAADNHNASYTKFLTDSRDQAFTYIEEVQSGLKDYIDIVGPQLEYYNTYGRASGGPHILMLDNILPAFEELKTLLPEDK